MMAAREVCLLSGAFGALGRPVAQALAAAGYALALVDAAAAPADAAFTVQTTAPDGPPALRLAGVDLTDEAAAAAAVAQTLQRFGRLDALVNIAGGFAWETVADGRLQTWERMFALNLKTAFNLAHAALPALRASGNGRIVNVGSSAAARAGSGMAAYAAAKSGVLRLTEALAEENKDLGVRANAILPSIIDTAANRRDMPQADFSRWVQPAELAEVVLFLLAPASRAVRGAALAVNGRV